MANDKRRSHRREDSSKATNKVEAKVELRIEGRSRRVSRARSIEPPGGDLMEVTASAVGSHRSSATARFGASAAYLLNEAASLARLRSCPPRLRGTDCRRQQGFPPRGLGRDTKGVSLPRVGGQLISGAVRQAPVQDSSFHDGPESGRVRLCLRY
jgi:hypothetical protein